MQSALAFSRATVMRSIILPMARVQVVRMPAGARAASTAGVKGTSAMATVYNLVFKRNITCVSGVCWGMDRGEIEIGELWR